jgi:hypothetical protein
MLMRIVVPNIIHILDFLACSGSTPAALIQTVPNTFLFYQIIPTTSGTNAAPNTASQLICMFFEFNDLKVKIIPNLSYHGQKFFFTQNIDGT